MLTPRRRTLSRVAAAALLTLVLAACGGGAAPATGGTPVADGALTVALQFSPRSGYALDTDDAFVLTQLGATETLLNTGPDGDGAPGLATAAPVIGVPSWRVP